MNIYVLFFLQSAALAAAVPTPPRTAAAADAAPPRGVELIDVDDIEEVTPAIEEPRAKKQKTSDQRQRGDAFVLEKVNLFRQNTYLQNKKHTLTCQGGTGCYRFNYQPGS